MKLHELKIIPIVPLNWYNHSKQYDNSQIICNFLVKTTANQPILSYRKQTKKCFTKI